MQVPTNKARLGDGAVLAAAALGFLLLVRYQALDAALVRGAVEFKYYRDALEPLPYAPMRGFTVEQLARHVGRLAILGPALLLLTPAIERLLAGAWAGGAALRHITRLAAAGALATSAWLMLGVLRGRAIIEDELTYRLQASLLTDGRLGDPAGESWPFPGKPFTVWTAHGTTGKYLFGEPVVQVVGSLLGVPALLHLPMAGLALWAVHRTVRGAVRNTIHDERAGSLADWSTILVAASPMFLFTTAVGLSDATAFALLAYAALGLQLVRERTMSVPGAVLAPALLVGVSLGFGLTVRPQVVGPGGACLGAAALWALVGARRWGATAVLVGSVTTFVGLVAAYDAALTGSPTTLPWDLYTPVESYGFGTVWEGQDVFTHTARTAIENLAVTTVRFNGWWLGWPASLGLLAAWAWLGRPTTGAGPYLAMGGAIVLFHVGYYSPGISDTGPVYYQALLLPAAVLGAHAIVAAGARWPGMVAAALAAHFVLGTGTFVAEHAARLQRLADFVNSTSEDVLARLPTPALLIVETRPAEMRRRGWVWSGFSRWDRGLDDPIVVYPRESAANARALQARFADRSCWYYRTNPEAGNGEIGPCDTNRATLEREP